MAEYADLELSLHRRDAGNYTVELRFTQPGSDADIRVGQGETIDVNLDLVTLQDMIVTPLDYGQSLAESLFADNDMKIAWAQARTSAQTLGVPMRVRLLIGPSGVGLLSAEALGLRALAADRPSCVVPRVISIT